MRKASRCFLLAMMVMVSAAGTAFAGEDEDEDTFEQKVIKKIMRGLGADVDQGRIEYRERSPIVIPPGRDLPPPESAAVVENPNWPKDPDQQLKKKPGSKSIRSDSVSRHNTERATISPQELENGRVAGAGGVTCAGVAGDGLLPPPPSFASPSATAIPATTTAATSHSAPPLPGTLTV